MKKQETTNNLVTAVHTLEPGANFGTLFQES